MARKSAIPQHTKPQPALDAYVIEGDGKNTHWTRIGVAWAHADEQGYNLQLLAVPLGGRLVLRVRKQETGE